MNYHVITLFPEVIGSYTNTSILGKAQKNGLITIKLYNLFEYLEDSPKGKLKKRVDDKPYGGGPGMVLRAKPVIKAIQDAVGKKKYVQIVHFAPSGKEFSTAVAKKLAKSHANKKIKDIVFICGRYEGIDSRIEQMFPGMKVSIGDYVLTGGELPALVMIDSISRQLPGVLGDSDSREEERISATKYYTRPESIRHKGKEYVVPKVLTSGDHKKIDEWRENH